MTPSKVRSSLTSALASGLALVALASGQAAQAQKTCVEPADVADAFVYALPGAYDTALKTCGNAFAPDSFIRSTKGAAFVEQFRSRQDKAWPGTFRFIKAYIAAQSGGDQGAMMMIAAMPEKTVRPFIDGLLGSMVGEKITPDVCPKINRVLELVSPLPAENFVGLATFAIEEVDLKEPDICKPGANGAAAPAGSGAK